MKQDMTTDLLAVQGLSASYGGVEALHGVTLRLCPGEIATVIGPNGAGKTTLLNAIMGVIPSRGVVSFAGEVLGLVPVEERLRRGLCLVPEKRELFATMSVAENLELGAYARRSESRAARRASLDEVYGLFPRLEERRKQLAGTLSGGERQMLAMGRALMARPRMLLLDEPSLGLDYTSQLAYQSRIRALAASGVAILLASNQVDEVESLCDRAAFLHRGKIVAEGTPEDLISRVEGVRRIVATLRNPVEYGSVAGGVKRVVPEGSDLIIHCEERPGIVADVVAGIVRSGGDIVNLSVHKPNLEDVFVKLTGEALKDEV
jgi:ABC-type branched-subunit amino acid transport system ATPase component